MESVKRCHKEVSKLARNKLLCQMPSCSSPMCKNVSWRLASVLTQTWRQNCRSSCKRQSFYARMRITFVKFHPRQLSSEVRNDVLSCGVSPTRSCAFSLTRSTTRATSSSWSSTRDTITVCWMTLRRKKPKCRHTTTSCSCRDTLWTRLYMSSLISET